MNDQHHLYNVKNRESNGNLHHSSSSHRGGKIGGGPNSASMKSIETSMTALSVSLSSYLTNNRGADESVI